MPPTLTFVYHLVLGPPTVDLEAKQVPFTTLYTQPPDDGLQMAPKLVEAR
jgi:hypothetical protein